LVYKNAENYQYNTVELRNNNNNNNNNNNKSVKPWQ